MRRLALIPVLLLALQTRSYGAEAQVPGIWNALGFTRARPETGKKRTMTFARQGLSEKWILTSGKDGQDSPPEVREEMLNKLSSALDKMPRFLQATQVPMFQWTEQAEGARPNGRADASFGISLRTSRGEKSFDDMVLHEVAHIYDEKNEAVVDAYHRIRLSTRQTDEGLARLYAHLRATNPGMDRWSTPKMDEEARRIFAELRLPRRSDTDLHAVSDGYEYWAVSVELYQKHRGDKKALDQYLSSGEQAFLEKLFSGK